MLILWRTLGSDMQLQTFEWGGIAYTLAIVKHNGQFYAQWHCPTCNAEDVVPKPCHAPAEAIGRAQARVFSDHHVPVHILENGSL
jgi:hypothetical protein